MVVIGLLLGMVGTDISLAAIAMGMFGVAEILVVLSKKELASVVPVGKFTMRSMLPKQHEMKGIWKTLTRGSLLGSFVGALPRAGPAIAAFMSYAAEKKVSKNPERFGAGAIEGIAAPESANKAAVQAAFIPTLSLGIPGDAVMAVLLRAMILHGVTPGPLLVTSQPEIFWGQVASFWVGNIMLLLMNLPLIKLWVKMLSIPYHLLYPAMLFFICIGVYSIRANVFDIYTTLAFGLIGFVLIKLRYPPAPLLLGYILGPMMEEQFRRALRLSRGDYSTFVISMPSALFMGVTLLLLVVSLVAVFRKRLNIRVMS